MILHILRRTSWIVEKVSTWRGFYCLVRTLQRCLPAQSAVPQARRCVFFIRHSDDVSSSGSTALMTCGESFWCILQVLLPVRCILRSCCRCGVSFRSSCCGSYLRSWCCGACLRSWSKVRNPQAFLKLQGCTPRRSRDKRVPLGEKVLNDVVFCSVC